MKPGVEWIILVTDKYSESLTFYRDTLGFKIEREVPEDQFCQFALAHCFVAIYGRSEMVKLLGEKYVGQPGGAIYSFTESEDIDADVQRLKDQGVTFIKEPATQPWGQRTAYFVDPDGHIWELQQWLKKS